VQALTVKHTHRSPGNLIVPALSASREGRRHQSCISQRQLGDETAGAA
jgi:hypothetical protein